MRRALVLTGVIAIGAVIGALAYRSAARERNYRLLIGAGEGAVAANETLAAIEDFSGAIAVRPDAMLARLRRGETYRSRGDLEVAARDFRAAAALDPTATRPLEALGDVLFAQERFKRAAETYEALLKLDDRSARARYKLAVARYREGAADTALDEARRAQALDPQLADVHYLAALCLRDMGRPAEAVVELEQALQRVPAMLPAREELADVLGTLNRRDDQLEQLQLLATLDGQRTERQITLSLAQARAGKPDLAIATLTAALGRARDQPPVYAALGRVWLQIAEDHRDRPEALGKALESLERGASALSATSETKALYGRALALSGQLEAAEQLFTQAMERYPLDPSALRDLGSVAERLGHAATAREALVRYASLVPGDNEAPQHAARIGALSLQLDDAEGALLWLQRALTAKPDDVQVLVWLAEAQLKHKDVEAALLTVQRALTLQPTNPQAWKLQQQARRMSNR